MVWAPAAGLIILVVGLLLVVREAYRHKND